MIFNYPLLFVLISIIGILLISTGGVNFIILSIIFISIFIIGWNRIKLGKKTDPLRIRRISQFPNVWVIQRKIYNKKWILYYPSFFSNETLYFRKSTEAKEYITKLKK
jgi:hypothetical protein